MKKIWAILLAVCMTAAMVLSMAACGGQNGDPDTTEKPDDTAKKVTVSDVFAQIRARLIEDAVAWEVIASADEVEAGAVPMFVVEDLKTPGITFENIEFDPAWIVDGTAAVAEMVTQSNRIIVLEAKDADSLARCKQAIDEMHAQQLSIWSTYLPAQYEKVENNIIETVGNFILYVTYDNGEAVRDIFRAALAEG